MGHLAQVKNPDTSVPWFGIAADEQQFILSETRSRQLSPTAVSSGNMVYLGPGLYHRHQTLTGANAATTILNAQQIPYAGAQVVAFGILFPVGPTIAGRDVTFGLAVSDTNTPYVAPTNGMQIQVTPATYAATGLWVRPSRLTIVKKNQYLLFETVAVGAAFTDGTATLVAALEALPEV